MTHATRHLFRTVVALAALAWGVLALADSNVSATAPPSGKVVRVESFRMAPGTHPVSSVVLGPMAPAEILAVKRANSLDETKRLQIGIGRDIPFNAESGSAALRWARVSGGFAAQWRVSSIGAQALRIGLESSGMPPEAQIRFAGERAIGTVYGPFTVTDLASGTPTYWSPVLEGQSAIVEVFVPAPASPADVSLAITRISHLFVSPADANADSLAKASGTCEVDLVCLSASDAALASVGKAVARMTFSDGLGGGTFLCTGTLLNPTDNSFTPYFYSANHCISTQASASTLTTHWFYDRTGCGAGSTSPNYVQVAGGATLLYANQSSDALLLRLNSTPPAAAVFAGWDSAALSTGVAMKAVHHPSGDLKKVSLSTMGGFGSPGTPSGSFIISNWNSTATGVTEPGSSGSGIFTAVGAPATDYKFRGGLYGGPSSCTATAPNLFDFYSRFDQVYPSIAQFLSPTPTSNPQRLGNISTRMQVLTGNDVMIGGFIIGGSTPKTVVIRARGPSLVPFGITNALADPKLDLYSGQTVIASNDDWGTASNLSAIQASGFAPGNSLESAILATLSPGAYTAIVSGFGGSTGVGIVEVFEVDHPEVPLMNISTRGQVLTGNDVMIGGFIIQGSGPQTVIVRARGPSLVPFGITNALANPMLQLYSGSTLVASNDDWGSASNAAAIQSSGFAPGSPLESAILVTLNPGAYTAIVSGAGGGTGVGIVEVFAQ